VDIFVVDKSMATMLKTSRKVEGAHSNCIWTLAWCEGNLLTGSLDGSVKLWDKDLNHVCTSQSHKVGVNSVSAIGDGSSAVACFQDGMIRFYNTADLQETSCIDAGLLEAWTVCVAPTNDVVVSGNHKGCVNIWAMSEGHPKVATLETNNKFIFSTAFNSRLHLATSGSDGVVNIFDVNTRQIMHKIEAHAMPIRSISFSPDGNILYTASDDRHVNVYDTISGSLINSFSHAGMALSVDASPNYRHFAVGCADHNVVLWDLGMQRRLQSFDQHTDQVWCVGFDKKLESGRKLASVGDDGLLQTYE
jgi:WD repeat-containing protein 61